MNRKEVEAILDSVVVVLRPMKQELKELRERISEMEAAPLKHLGTHEPGRLYVKNTLVTDQAGTWVALRTTQQTPGDGDGWRHCGSEATT